MSAEKSGLGLPVVIIAALLAFFGGAYVSATGALAPIAPIFDHMDDGESCGEDIANTEELESEPAAEVASADVIVPLNELAPLEAMLKPRVLGFPGAPIKVTEHSSFACSHCGQFHRETFEQFKNEYLVTGKAALVFEDFPLNAPALYASMLTRCVAEEHYFDMVQELFDTQDDWAFNTSYLDTLKETAANYGLSEPLYKECIENNDLRQGLLAQMQQAQQESNVSSTPTFVINDIGQIKGALPYDEFKGALEAAVAPALTPAPAPVSGE